LRLPRPPSIWKACQAIALRTPADGNGRRRQQHGLRRPIGSRRSNGFLRFESQLLALRPLVTFTACDHRSCQARQRALLAADSHQGLQPQVFSAALPQQGRAVVDRQTMPADRLPVDNARFAGWASVGPWRRGNTEPAGRYPALPSSIGLCRQKPRFPCGGLHSVPVTAPSGQFAAHQRFIEPQISTRHRQRFGASSVDTDEMLKFAVSRQP